MKRIVLKFGLISGAISAALMSAFVPFIYKIGFDYGTVLGYSAMVLAFLLVFFGIRSYRETVGNGHISFGRAFQVGILITLISSICYIVAWEIIYFNFLPDFVEKYSSYVIEKERASGASAEQIAQKAEEIRNIKWVYESPLLIAAVTFLEPFPVGLIMTVISALILRKRREVPEADDPIIQGSGVTDAR